MSVIDTSNMIFRDPLIQGFTYEELEPGKTAYFTKTITEHDVYTFAGVTGDYNPAHVNQTGAEEMKLPGRIARSAIILHVFKYSAMSSAVFAVSSSVYFFRYA